MKLAPFLILLYVLHSITFSQDSTSSYLFSYFKGNGEDGLHLAYSTNGFHWTALNNDSSFLKPLVGNEKLMRDPCIIQGKDGLYHMVWTVSWKEKGIGYANSPDLIHWSGQQYIPVMQHEPNAQNSWAPELLYDDTQDEYCIYWSTGIPGRFPETDNQSDAGPPAPGRNHRLYYCTTKDFKSFSPARLFYEKGFNVIDASIIRFGKQYAMFIKDETNKPFTPQKNIRIAYAETLQGPYGLPSEPITGKYWAEGPSAIEIGGQWIVYFDKYKLRRYDAVMSKDLKCWVDVSDALIYPAGMRHGSVFRVPKTVLDALKNTTAAK